MQIPILFLAALFAQAPDTATPPGGPSTSSDTVLGPAVQVKGSRRRTGGAVVDASIGRNPAPLHETPRAITVLQSDDLRDRDVRTVAEALSLVPGVFTNGTNGAEGYHYKARGFHMLPAVYLVDGFPGVRTGGDYTPSLFGMDRVVFVRGPAGLEYGAMTVPGGMVNMITKAPRDEPLGRVDLRLGPWSANSAGFGQAASGSLDVDFAGRASDDGRLLYRVAGEWEDASGFTADTRDSARRFLGSFLWKLDERGRFTIRPLAMWDWTSRRAGASTAISPSSSLSTADGSTALNLSDLTPASVNTSAGGRQDEQFTLGFDAKARLAEGWSADLSYRWLSYDTRVDQWTPVAATLAQSDPADPRSWTIQRRQTRSETDRFGHAFNGDLRWEVTTFADGRNTATAGLNGRFSGTDRSVSGTGPAQSTINVYSGVATAPLRDSNLALVPAFLTRTLAWNLYLMDQLSLWKERLVVSGGLAWAGESNDRLYSRTSILRDTVANLGRILSDKSGGPVPTLGALVQVSPEIAVYGSYSTSYSLAPGDYEDRSGRSGGFDPTTGVDVEGGVKFDVRDASATLTVFRMDQEGVLVQSAANDLNSRGNRYWTQGDDDGRESFGVELELSASPLRGWTTALVGSWIDARVKSSTDPVADGSPVDKTPEWAATWSNRYAFTEGFLAGLSAAATVNWQTERWMSTRSSAAPDPLVMPWTTKVDVGLAYKLSPRLEIAANVENLFDERIVESGSTGSSLVLGSPRNLVLRAGWTF